MSNLYMYVPNDKLTAAGVIAPGAPLELCGIVAAAHLNHQAMPGLGGKTSCELFHSGRPRAMVTTRQRKEVTDQLIIIAGEILQEMDDWQPRMALKAWRLAFERWLLMNNHISVTQPKVSPIFRTKGLS